ncbi:hypothetical protein [uncultured Desulfosarcina sp.]|uniref:hypothetical protein n=1 Tax=uncultured Desulfosarcina sp. TaxID=218289 RepID=UPI0029C97F79|nr:hypothetical protein [uncultured Desulfosarcina sp.]
MDRPFGVVGQHGLACFIDTEAGRVLFDTGRAWTPAETPLSRAKTRHRCGQPPSAMAITITPDDGHTFSTRPARSL